MRIIAAFAAVGGFVGALVAGALYWLDRPTQGWMSFTKSRGYVDYLGVRPSDQVTTRFLLVTIGGGVVGGLVVGALLAVVGVRLIRVSGSSPTG